MPFPEVGDGNYIFGMCIVGEKSQAHVKKGMTSMLTTDKDFDGISDNNHPTTYYGLSTDTKPTKNVINGAIFIEINTGKAFFFDRANTTWLEV